MNPTKSHKSFGGHVRFWKHDSTETKTEMAFSTYEPPGKTKGCLIWLSGLTCNEENFITKASAQPWLAEAGLAVVCPDTSPRGLDLPGEHEDWDFGSGAGFYVDATTPGYRDHYRMYSYIVHELYRWVSEHFGIGDKISISGHSMGGHGALVMGLREPAKFRSVSAFSPIVAPTKCPWGQKAFRGYLGTDQSVWAPYDTCELIRSGARHPGTLLVDQGTTDAFLERELMTPRLVDICNETDQKADVHLRDGYDHSYFFIASHIADHVRFHSAALN